MFEIGFVVLLFFLLIAVIYIHRANNRVLAHGRDIHVLKNEIHELEGHKQALLLKLLDVRRSHKDLESCFTAAFADVGSKSRDKQIAYYETLRDEILAQIHDLENAQEKGGNVAPLIQPEIDKTVLVDVKERFRSYAKKLEDAGVAIPAIVKLFLEDLEFIENFLILLKSQRLNVSMGRVEIKKIEEVLQNLESESTTALIEEIKIKNKKQEIEYYQKLRDAKLNSEKKDRDQTLSDPKVLKAAVDPCED